MSRCASGENGVFARNASHVMPLEPPRPRPPPGVPTTRRAAPKGSLSKKDALCRPRIDAARLHRPALCGAVRERRGDAGGAAVRDPQPAAGPELVALRVAAE